MVLKYSLNTNIGRVLGVFVCLAMIPAGAMASDWPSWRGPNRDGKSAETDWSISWGESGPKQLWKKNVGIGCSSMVIFDGKLYSAGNADNQDTIYCLDAATGNEIWKHSYPAELDPKMFEGGPGATPIVDDGHVYMLSRDGDILCLNAADGNPVWSKKAQSDFGAKKPSWGFSGSPLVVGDVVYFGADALIAFNKKTGDVIWKTDKNGVEYAAPILYEYNGTQYIVTFGKSGLSLHKLSDGSLAARLDFGMDRGVQAATPVVKDDLIFISAGYNKGAMLARFDGAKLEKVWDGRVMRNKFSSCVLVGDHLYGFDENTLKCIELKSGAVKWESTDFGHGTMIVAGGMMIIFSEQGGELAVAEANPNALEVVVKHQILDGRSWVAPALANGHLYVKNNNGDMAALDLTM
jgi:outer membrane protein assembly factor BamB